MKQVFFPVFQDVVDVKTRKVCWVEALARISGDTSGKGHVPFIRMAERYGFVHLLDRAILHNVLDVHVSIGMPVAVNVSVLTIERHPSAILELLQKAPAAANDLILEITETAQVKELVLVQDFLLAARRLGCKVAVDDFGTGFFTTELVAALAPDIIKLSKTLVDKVCQTDNLELVSGIAAVSHELGAHLLAEGLDSLEKFEVVERMGCRYAQGFALGRPANEYGHSTCEF